ncbi:SDR family oxidoreductase [Luteococcus peritonei]|uniref:SDR family oxidoreductase n=1 Tax=Luteococcus peritonei TaxID=88874 RepID=A0ABW4RU32_9ACTN
MTMLGVTGATGRVGGLVARLLAEAGREQRLLVRSPERAPQLPGAQAVTCSYEDSEATRAALQGIDVLFMVSAAEAADRLEQHRAFIDATAAAGVRHVVYTSFMGAAPDAVFTLGRDHGATEEHLRASGMATTMLRDNFYIDVFPDFATDGVIAGPAGQGRVSAVAIADVARVAATVLQDPSAHVGAVHELTGPEALTLDEMAQAITRATGTSVRYHDESLAEAYASREPYGAEPWQVEAWVSTYTAIASGQLARTTDAVKQVTGKPPLTVEAALARR